MRKLRRFGVLAIAIAGGYLACLAVLGVVLQGVVSRRIADRLAAALDARVTVGSASVGLVTGEVELRNVHVEREQGGHLELDIELVHADVAVLGWAVIDREPEHVRVRKARMSLSAPGALSLPERPERPPMRVGGLHLEDVTLALMPTALLPGLGRIEVSVAEARTGPVELRSSIDWVFAVRELRATAELPGGIMDQASVHYGQGQLTIGGSIFGSTPMTVPFELPRPDPDALEQDKLRVLARAIIEQLAVKGSRIWLERKLMDKALDLLAP